MEVGISSSSKESRSSSSDKLALSSLACTCWACDKTSGDGERRSVGLGGTIPRARRASLLYCRRWHCEGADTGVRTAVEPRQETSHAED